MNFDRRSFFKVCLGAVAAVAVVVIPVFSKDAVDAVLKEYPCGDTVKWEDLRTTCPPEIWNEKMIMKLWEKT